MEHLKDLANPMVVLALFALLGIEIVKRRERSREQKRDLNGGNPVVKAIVDLKHCVVMASGLEHEKTRQHAKDLAAQSDKSLTEHRQREEFAQQAIVERLEDIRVDLARRGSGS